MDHARHVQCQSGHRPCVECRAGSNAPAFITKHVQGPRIRGKILVGIQKAPGLPGTGSRVVALGHTGVQYRMAATQKSRSSPNNRAPWPPTGGGAGTRAASCSERCCSCLWPTARPRAGVAGMGGRAALACSARWGVCLPPRQRVLPRGATCAQGAALPCCSAGPLRVPFKFARDSWVLGRSKGNGAPDLLEGVVIPLEERFDGGGMRESEPPEHGCSLGFLRLSANPQACCGTKR